MRDKETKDKILALLRPGIEKAERSLSEETREALQVLLVGEGSDSRLLSFPLEDSDLRGLLLKDSFLDPLVYGGLPNSLELQIPKNLTEFSELRIKESLLRPRYVLPDGGTGLLRYQKILLLCALMRG